MFQLVPKWDGRLWNVVAIYKLASLAVIFDIEPLISFQFIKNESSSKHLH